MLLHSASKSELKAELLAMASRLHRVEGLCEEMSSRMSANAITPAPLSALMSPVTAHRSLLLGGVGCDSAASVGDGSLELSQSCIARSMCSPRRSSSATREPTGTRNHSAAGMDASLSSSFPLFSPAPQHGAKPDVGACSTPPRRWGGHHGEAPGHPGDACHSAGSRTINTFNTRLLTPSNSGGCCHGRGQSPGSPLQSSRSSPGEDVHSQMRALKQENRTLRHEVSELRGMIASLQGQACFSAMRKSASES